MGGCRPLLFMDNFVDLAVFDIVYHGFKTALKMLTSEITVVRKSEANDIVIEEEFLKLNI